jgi:hypothetical protein
MRREGVLLWCPDCGEGELDVVIHPGEPAVMYYPDGSGYPGAPAETEIVGQTCDCEPDLDTVHDLAISAHAEREAGEEDAAWDAKIERDWERERYGD